MSLRHKLRWTHVQCEVCPSPWCSGRPPWDGRKSKDFPSCGGNMSIPGWRCLLGARAAHPLRRNNIWTTTGKTCFMMPKLRGTISIPGWRCLLDVRAARYGTPECMEPLIRARILKPKLRGGISYAGWRCLLGAWAEPPWDARMQTKTTRETLILRLKIQ